MTSSTMATGPTQRNSRPVMLVVHFGIFLSNCVVAQKFGFDVWTHETGQKGRGHNLEAGLGVLEKQY